MKKDMSRQGNLPIIQTSIVLCGVLFVGFVFLMLQVVGN